jgi:hypothetical protein
LLFRQVAWDPQERLSTWSSSNDISQERSPPTGKFIGVEKIMSADLLLSEVVGTWKGYEHPVGKPLTEEQLPGSDYDLLHFPDGLSLYFPKYVKKGMGSFHISAHWAVDGRRIHQATVLYGETGGFESYRTGHYLR